MTENIEDQISEHLSPLEVGELLAISPIMVRKLVQDGKLKPVSKDGLKRFARDEIERYACENNITIIQPEEEFLKILIIDDEKPVTDYLVEFFLTREQNIKAEFANNAEDAHSKIKTFKPHIVLLDIMMPDLDGFDICNLLKLSPLTRGIRVIAMSGCCTKENSKIMIDSGAEICLPKPIDQTKLLEIIGL